MAADVLAGPVLRRVEAGSVSVLLVLRYPARIALAVYPVEGGWAGDGRVAAAERPAAVVTGERKTVAIGQSIHVAVVTAAAGAGLAPDTIYHYDMQVENGAGSVSTFNTLGLLDTRPPAGLPLGYEPGLLPVVVLPPSQLTDLRLWHGSCRKPHAPGVDALAVLDERIAEARTDPRARPHQLVLTGDQIYADDVAASVAVPLHEQAKLLMWGAAPGSPVESIVLREGEPPVPFTDPALGPDSRQRWVRTLGDPYSMVPREAVTPTGFSSTEAANHLFAFAEFVTMYLMAWSESAWPDRVFARNPVAPDPPDVLGVTPDEDETEAVTAYLTTLPRVRRILANVACYMQCDDHEVTDDWNLDRAWGTRVHRSPSGPRVIVNGLAAYAVFQWWGTAPAAFGTGRGAELLNLLEDWRGTDDARRATIARRLGVAPPDSPVPDGERIDLHTRVEFGTHVLVVLDTRTRRGPRPPTPSGERMRLIDGPGLDQQLPAPATTDLRPAIVLSPPPVLGLPLVEEGLQGLLGRTMYGRSLADVETWFHHRAGLYALLDRLAEHRSVVLLSGDVHYGFTIACEWWRPGTGPATIVQLTSSALKNQAGLTTKLHTWALRLERLARRSRREFALWTGTPARYRFRALDSNGMPVGSTTGANTSRPDRAVAVASAPFRTEASRPPDALFRITAVLAESLQASFVPVDLPADRSAPVPVRWDDPVGTAAFTARVAEAHSDVLELGGSVGRWLVGYNNLGEVRFTDGPRTVSHRLWWAVPHRDGTRPELERAAPLTVTRHRLDAPPDSERPVVGEMTP